MKIWIDADAAPNAIRELIFRAASKRKVEVVLVANRPQPTPRSRWVRSVVVSAGLDVADDYIVAHCEAGDLVITADIPLAAEAVEKGARVLQPRGEELTAENVRGRLSTRDFMTEARASGLVTGGGPPPLRPADRQRFANALDRWLTSQGR